MLTVLIALIEAKYDKEFAGLYFFSMILDLFVVDIIYTAVS